MAKNINSSSSSTLFDTPCMQQKKKNMIVTMFQHISSRKGKSYYYVCLGSLVHMIDKQMEKRYSENERLSLMGSRYIKKLRKLIEGIKYNEFLVNDFLKSLITSVALFAVGIKLSSELVACKLF